MAPARRKRGARKLRPESRKAARELQGGDVAAHLNLAKFEFGNSEFKFSLDSSLVSLIGSSQGFEDIFGNEHDHNDA